MEPKALRLFVLSILSGISVVLLEFTYSNYTLLLINIALSVLMLLLTISVIFLIVFGEKSENITNKCLVSQSFIVLVILCKLILDFDLMYELISVSLVYTILSISVNASLKERQMVHGFKGRDGVIED